MVDLDPEVSSEPAESGAAAEPEHDADEIEYAAALGARIVIPEAAVIVEGDVVAVAPAPPCLAAAAAQLGAAQGHPYLRDAGLGDEVR
jgi:hypothetical protein